MPLHFPRSSDFHRACGFAVLALALSGCSPPLSPLETELARCNAINFLPQRAACVDNAYGARAITPTKGTTSITPTSGATSNATRNPAPSVPYPQPKASGGPTPLAPGTSVK